MSMTMAIPLEVLDMNCRDCPQFKPVIESTPIFDEQFKKIIGYVVKSRCVNLPLCEPGPLERTVQ